MLTPEHLLWLKECIIIFFMSFLHEDAAIIAAAFAHLHKALPVPLAYISVYFGIVVGDNLIYGLGHFAGKSAWLQSKIIGPRVEKLKIWLQTHLLRVLILCRVTPGLIFPTFVACGWFRIPFIRFATISILTGAIYSSILLTLVILFGDIVLSQLGYWGWGALVAIILAIALKNMFKSYFGRKNDKQTVELPPSFVSLMQRKNPGNKHKFHGMPSLNDLKTKVMQAEHIPNSILYIPLGLYYIFLGIKYRSLTLPSASNPMIETGGFMGESKSSVLNMTGENQKEWIADFSILNKNGEPAETDLRNALVLMEEKNISFPVVAKPDIGWNGYGVRLIDDSDHLLQYISEFPRGQNIILQRHVPFDGEAGIFYTRIPGEKKGKIYSVTLRYFPFVKGDGKSTLKSLILNDERTKIRSGYYLGGKPEHVSFNESELEHVPAEGEIVRLAFIGSLRVGGLYRNASHIITPELTERFDNIAQSMPEFYFGRFDIRFESVEKLMKGEGFSIIEINGAGAEAIQAWDPEKKLSSLYREFFKAYRLLFLIGDLNRSRGFKPMSFRDFIKAIRRQNRLIEQYPPAG